MLFGSKQPSIVGIDVGTSSIKLVELLKENEGTYRLITYGFVDNIQRDVRGIGKDDISQVAETVKLMCTKSGVTTAQATAALPTYVVFTSLISLPKLSHDELDSAIHWEAKKIIPLPLEDIILDYKILGGEGEKRGGISLPFLPQEKKEDQPADPADVKVLITGAAKETVQVYTDIFQKSGLMLTSLETEMFALARSLASHTTGEAMIVEVGAAVTDIIIVQDGIPFLGRSIETGGNALTRAITTSLNISEKRAEQLKRDVGVTILDDANSGGGVTQILKDTLEPIIHEIRYTLDLYKNHSVTPLPHASGTVEKIILTGGSALLPNLVQYLSKALDMRVLLGDPWEHVTYNEELKPLLAALGPKFSVAIGLAMRGV